MAEPVALRLGEVIVELVIAKLQRELPARISTINAEAELRAYPSGDFELQVPKKSDYYRTGLSSIPEAPALIVAEAATPEFGEEGPHSFITGTDVAIWILEQDADRQRLGKKLQRQRRAVIEALWDGEPREQLDSQAFRVFPVRTQPGRTFDPDQDDTWRSLFLVLFRVQQLEG